tara:strand:+ start:234 stop:890 length:657 start_codon:yes stop_codon:yes gene_type:complete
MKKRTLISILLLIFLTTFTSQNKTSFEKFNLKEIVIENNVLLKQQEVKTLLKPFYDSNLIFINNLKIKKTLLQNDFIDGFDIKKKYPNTLKVKIYEKKPIAILIEKKKKFYLSEKIDLIEFKKIDRYKELPYVLGTQKEFKKFYNDLKKIKFPFQIVNKYILYDSNRWDLETKSKIIVKLPQKNYIKSLNNYLKIKNEKNFSKFVVFDYRINSQLILK